MNLSDSCHKCGDIKEEKHFGLSTGNNRSYNQ